MSTLHVLHFNDVYRVAPQKLDNTGKTIDVTQFAARLADLRAHEPDKTLVLFSGDVFSPSVESSVTRGSHMVPVMNELAPDVTVVGNHDVDFGVPHLAKLIKDCKFPWLLSNVVDKDTGRVPEPFKEFHILERGGVRIGVIGLIEEEWIATINAWPSNFQWRKMEEVGIELSKKLRDPKGEHKCDILIALTHARVPNDVKLGQDLNARPSDGNDEIAKTHGVDIIYGGHDHLYYVAKGAKSWENYDLTHQVLGAEKEDGVLVVKSGTDFRDLSEMTIELVDSPPGSVRSKTIKAVTGIHHETAPEDPKSESLAKILSSILSDVSDTLKAPICKTDAPLDCHSELIRTEESAAGNWFSDILRNTYDDALCMKSGGGAHCVFSCAGTLRGDSTYGPGDITLGDIMEILPFEDPIVVLELDGEAIWAAMEGALSKWPAQEGRFPLVSGLRVTWDSSKPAGNRVLTIQIEATPQRPHVPGDATPHPAPQWRDLKREKGGEKYRVVTREYLAQGHDGFEPFKGYPYLIDDENGIIMSTIVRRYLLGSQYIHALQQLEESPQPKTVHLNERTDGIIRNARDRWRNAAAKVLRAQRNHVQDAFHVANREHMSNVDCYDGQAARSGTAHREQKGADLITIHPVVDGRMKDVARSK
ncbi:Metallo-dependent phosphatase [Exidia glandulosa HHB12029]|uniref:Metallo-dependent phosphatase n=1 Tax=Exidia glandulosa HHB12029 TaxID=1314781 RepID=A0A165D9Q2_EXIGL|nr:Metallo-dependent phosphatase [Exidia glandulosa HHB12029]